MLSISLSLRSPSQVPKQGPLKPQRTPAGSAQVTCYCSLAWKNKAAGRTVAQAPAATKCWSPWHPPPPADPPAFLGGPCAGPPAFFLSAETCSHCLMHHNMLTAGTTCSQSAATCIHCLLHHMHSLATAPQHAHCQLQDAFTGWTKLFLLDWALISCCR